MKNRYFGDVNDYVKYCLLRCLADTGLRVGICWMLTEADSRPAGKKVAFLRHGGWWRNQDPQLFDFLADSLSGEHDRNVRMLEQSGLIQGGVFFAEVLHDDFQSRREYFDEAARVLSESDVIFFDPDTGMGKTLLAGRKGSSRYVYWHEVLKFWESGHSLVLFQRFGHENRAEFTMDLLARLGNTTGSRNVVAMSTPRVVFLLASHPAHDAVLAEAIQLIETRMGDRLKITRLSQNEPRERADGPPPDKHLLER